MKTLADGTQEPVAIDSNTMVNIKGITMLYGEVKGVGTIRPGKVPRHVSERDYASLTFWKNGTEYVVWGSNISKDELVKVAESMIEQI